MKEPKKSSKKPQQENKEKPALSKQLERYSIIKTSEREYLVNLFVKRHPRFKSFTKMFDGILKVALEHPELFDFDENLDPLSKLNEELLASLKNQKMDKQETNERLNTFEQKLDEIHKEIKSSKSNPDDRIFDGVKF